MGNQINTIPAEEITGVIEKIMQEDMEITIPVTGNSMLPLWRHQRDSVTLTACNKVSLKKGDIPLYRRSNGQFVLHRIVRVNPGSYDLCGDAQTIIEHGLSPQCIIAVVCAFSRKGRFYRCDNPVFRIYSRIWILLLPVRRVFVFIKKRLKRLTAFSNTTNRTL